MGTVIGGHPENLIQTIPGNFFENLAKLWEIMECCHFALVGTLINVIYTFINQVEIHQLTVWKVGENFRSKVGGDWLCDYIFKSKRLKCSECTAIFAGKLCKKECSKDSQNGPPIPPKAKL